jgi:AcrR family transcriptional regulator
MNRTIVPNGGPKLRLVEAAEKLFAEKGFDVVSVRDITQAAGGNVAAVNYHFGSRDGLVAVVMSRYITPVNEQRLAGLEAAERKWADKAVPVEEVVDAFVRPLLTQIRESELSERLFHMLVGRIFGSHGNGMPAEIEERFGALINRFIKVLGRSLPGLSEEELLWRLHFVVGAMLYMLTHGETLQRVSQGAAGAPSMEATLARFLSFAAAGLRDGVLSSQAEMAASQARADGHGSPLQGDDEVDLNSVEPGASVGGHRSPLQGDDEVDLDPVELGASADGHGAPLQGDGEAEQMSKVGKKKSRKGEQESPQVMFEF